MTRRFYAPMLVLLTCLLWVAPDGRASDDWQYWSRYTLKTHSFDRVELATYFEGRLNEDLSQDGLYQISEQFKYKLRDDLDLGLNYTYLEQRSVNSKTKIEVFKYNHRAEIELSPRWKPADWLQIKNRNRLEFRWIEDQGSDNTRFRQRWELVFPIKNAAPVQSIFVNSEYFFDFKQSQIVENRAIPFGVQFKLNDKASLSVFYMIQARKGPLDWSSNQIVGTHLTISF
jgi:hypothetical protein